ncbi:hypothetical protein GCM10011611_25190 [Aliidongia dinghuensis]|uniref:Uncharacterized protein n=1 Tax=Aliidongia dinghuensis TaxID=1867774 RepID=A0A8J3E3R5_9PROT|nr:hypothetical protein [Aliidongia dinghuensis]GGF18273.1 hypothetical protein GCM10011611_25190 [Aliidongia dinghuensis]
MAYAAPGLAGQIWLSGVDPVVAADRMAGSKAAGQPTSNDFMSLFRPDAAWSKAASNVQIVKLSTQFFHRASDEQLSTAIKDLQRRHIALGLEAEILTTSEKCGNGVPGYTTTAVFQKLANRVTGLGGKIEVVAFDEPMTWGHFAHKGAACGYSTEELVRNITPNVKILKTAFPGVKFGDIEPVTDQTADRLDEILNFARQFQAQTGERLAFLQADLIWQNKWQPQLAEWRTRLRAAGISYGVIIDGDPGDKTDTEWTRHATERYRMVAGNPDIRPDDWVFQSWQARPSRLLPETDPGTLTSVIAETVGAR